MFDVKKNKAICIYPFVHEYRGIEGRVAPCCHGDSLRGNETLAYIRQDMLNGIQPRACKSCYVKENESGYSPRIEETIDWIKKFGKPDPDNIKTQFVDIRYDPTCNLKCKMCGPKFSTLWQKEKKVSYPVNVANKHYLQNIDKKHLKKVYLAGGEPTYIKGYHDFLEELYGINPECEVVINSNLKKLSDKWKTIIKKFKNLTVVCSCDSVNTLGRYIRYPLGWDEFEDNVRFVSKNANFLQFNLVASALTSHKLYETCMWMKKYSKNIDLSILEYPECMSERSVPMDQRQVYIDNIQKISKFPVSVHYAMNFRNKVKYLIKKYAESPYDNILHQTLTKEINEQDSHRTLKLQDVDAFLYGWIHR